VSPGGATLGQACTIPANALVPGTALRFTASGIYSTTGTPNLTLALYYGGQASGVQMAATAATAAAAGGTGLCVLLGSGAGIAVVAVNGAAGAAGLSYTLEFTEN
jgi:hypothetical protein